MFYTISKEEKNVIKVIQNEYNYHTIHIYYRQ